MIQVINNHFLFLIILNLLIAIIFLLISFGKVHWNEVKYKTVNASLESPYSNRRTYFLIFLVMILCPIIAPLYFLLGFIFGKLLSWNKSNLVDVIFHKDRIRTHLKANEKRDRSIIPLEEAILLNEKKDLRRVMLNILQEDFQDRLSTIKLALESEDSETSHYAASILSMELNAFRSKVNLLWKQIQEGSENQTQYEIVLLNSMNDLLKQQVFAEDEQRKYVSILEAISQSFYDKSPNEFKLQWYENICLRTLELNMFDLSIKWCERQMAHFPEELSSYTCQLKLYFALQDKDTFFKVLDELKQSKIAIDNETLELIRIFN